MMSMLRSFVRIPYPVRLGMMLLGGGALGFLAFSKYQLAGLAIFVGGAICVALIIGLYIWIVRLLAKRKARRFGQQMKSQSGAAHHGVTEAEQLAKLDDLRRKFEEGVETFRTAGKDIYSLPWYLVIGEPGSGKTEAIRRSGIGFPPGLQDELQGVGGTINMSWWFTNSAVIIDTAGRLMFEDVQAAGSSEWKEFLRLLRGSRPNCPVNGLLLVIPADSLIRDSAETIQNKASKIAGQLDLIQRSLDIRFPVFIVVTKCDLVNGFREFFGDLDSPDQQQQILGWSNPNPIDDAFSADILEDHIAAVRQRLEKRRLLLLRDPVPAGDLSEQRVDEVDTLYDFPHSFMRVIPRLKQYLQTCFAAGEWSAKPLFLRGIYFTSSMREGAALDAELAETLGVPMESLPEGRAWERDRAFFLRDLFTRKVFAERGLVTRASNVVAQDRRRKMMVMGAGIVSALILLLLTWVGGHSLKKTIGEERDLWVYAASALSGESARDYPWPPIVAPAAASKNEYVYQGPTRLRGLGRGKTVGNFQRELQVKIQEPVRIPLIFRAFRPFTKSLDAERREARRVLFESCVLRPTVEMARAKMIKDEAREWSPTAAAALAELIRIEANALKLGYAPGDDIDIPLDIDALFTYLLTDPEDYRTYDYNDRSNWELALAWCYQRDGGRGAWPPSWLSAGPRLRSNRAIDVGSRGFVKHCCNPPALVSLQDQLATVADTWSRLAALENRELKNYEEAEVRFFRVFAVNLNHLRHITGYERIVDEWRDQYGDLREAMQAVEEGFAPIKTAHGGLDICREASIQDAYMAIVSNSIKEIEACYQALPLPESQTELRARSGEFVESDDELTLIDDIRARMKVSLRSVEEELAQDSTASELAQFQAKFMDTKAAVTAFEKRFGGYEPLVMSDDIRIRKQPWAVLREQISRMDVVLILEDLETFCQRIDEALGQMISAEPSEAKGALKAARERATGSAGLIDSRNFRSECEQAVGGWGNLAGDGTKDRVTLLSLPVRDFTSRYMIKTASSENYVAQYWDAAIVNALESVADSAVQDAKAKLPGLRQYARFPLTSPAPGVTSLSADKLYEASRQLAQIQPWPSEEEPKTLGGGLDSGHPLIDRQLQRLRDLDIGEEAKWLAASKTLLAALPPDPKRSMLCTVSLLPGKEQQRLLQAYGGGNIRDDSVLPTWRVMSLTDGSKREARRTRTTQSNATQLGRIMYPGEGFSMQFFSHTFDEDPSRTITVEDPWGALRLVHDYACEQNAEAPKKWVVQIPLEDDGGHKRVIWLQLDFEQPLPSLEDWPKASGI